MPAAARKIVQPESLRAQIHDDLRRRLQGLEFGPDDRLVDTEVARDYGTSRMPAREALMLLAAQGFLRPTGRGFAVPRLTPDEVREVFEVRRLLEPEAAARACAALRAPGLGGLAAARARAAAACAAGDARALMLANMEFRAVWIASVPNRRLRDAIAAFSDHVQAVRIATLRARDVQSVVAAGIDRLHAGFAARNADATRAAMADFMAAAEAAYFRAVGPT